MKDSFYQFALRHRGGIKNDAKYRFAEKMFDSHDFPKASTDFHQLSTYIEMQADEDLNASVFDELWEEYQSRR